MADKRIRYAPSTRQRAFEMAVYEGYDRVEDIARELGVNESTLRRWRSEDNWTDAKEEGTTASFVNIRNNLMLVIHRMSQRLVESMLSAELGALLGIPWTDVAALLAKPGVKTVLYKLLEA